MTPFLLGLSRGGKSQHVIFLQPLPDPFMLGLVFGFYVTDDLLELGFITDAIEHRIFFEPRDKPIMHVLTLVDLY